MLTFIRSINNRLLKRKNVIKQKYYKKEICPCLDFEKINKNTKVKDYQVVMQKQKINK